MMWTAAAAFAVAAGFSWWNAIEDGAGLRDTVPAWGLTAAAVIWFINAHMAKAQARASEGDSR